MVPPRHAIRITVVLRQEGSGSRKLTATYGGVQYSMTYNREKRAWQDDPECL